MYMYDACMYKYSYNPQGEDVPLHTPMPSTTNHPLSRAKVQAAEMGESPMRPRALVMLSRVSVGVGGAL